MKTKVAVIGFGFMGMTHTANILKNSDLELVAIVNRDVANIERKLNAQSGNFAIEGIDPAKLAGVRKYSSLRECLSNEVLDAVHICVHTDLHYKMAREALEHGVHVLVEKPFTLDLEEGEELIELARAKNRVLMVAQVVRFMPVYRQLKAWVDDRTFGNLEFLSMTRFSGVPAWGQWQEKQTDFSSSGGALFDLLVHDIDFAQYMLGMPDTVKSTYWPGYLSPQDYVTASWHYDNQDVEVKVEGGNLFHASFPFQAGFMARFTEASVQFGTQQPDVIQVATHKELYTVPVGSANEGFYEQIACFYRSIAAGRNPVDCSPESALQTIELCYKHL